MFGTCIAAECKGPEDCEESHCALGDEVANPVCHWGAEYKLSCRDETASCATKLDCPDELVGVGTPYGCDADSWECELSSCDPDDGGE